MTWMCVQHAVMSLQRALGVVNNGAVSFKHKLTEWLAGTRDAQTEHTTAKSDIHNRLKALAISIRYQFQQTVQ